MLIEFRIKNFRSFRDSQTLSLVRTKGKELESTHTFEASPSVRLVKTAALYGPNAGGKTNLLRAIGIMQAIVLRSAGELHRGDRLPVTPFRLDDKTTSLPSEFEVIFIADGVRYQYGFSATAEQVMEEWLVAFPKGRPQRWFERIWDDKQKTHRWNTGHSFSGEKQLWQNATRDNALFLSTAVQLNSEQLQPVYDWFRTSPIVVGVDYLDSMPSVLASLTSLLCKEQSEARTAILGMLQIADFGIDDITFKTRTLEERIPEGFPEKAGATLVAEFDNFELPETLTQHRTIQGKPVTFRLEDESGGTQKYFGLTGPIHSALEHGLVLFVDELQNNLHPKLTQFLLSLFHSKKTNPKNAQLIFTTHETSLLNQATLRRDQIWFCEKDKTQKTDLYPLTDFSPRKGRENLEASYLSGRYGALPYIEPDELP